MLFIKCSPIIFILHVMCAAAYSIIPENSVIKTTTSRSAKASSDFSRSCKDMLNTTKCTELNNAGLPLSITMTVEGEGSLPITSPAEFGVSHGAINGNDSGGNYRVKCHAKSSSTPSRIEYDCGTTKGYYVEANKYMFSNVYIYYNEENQWTTGSTTPSTPDAIDTLLASGRLSTYTTNASKVRITYTIDGISLTSTSSMTLTTGLRVETSIKMSVDAPAATIVPGCITGGSCTVVVPITVSTNLREHPTTIRAETIEQPAGSSIFINDETIYTANRTTDLQGAAAIPLKINVSSTHAGDHEYVVRITTTAN